MRALEERFWTKVERHPTDCWNWIGAQRGAGYGSFRISTHKTTAAHRMAYELANGEIGELHVLHTCDNRKCVRPSHLFLGTHLENVADCKAKGRTKSPKRGWYWRNKTHCKNGHEFAGENLYVYRGHRMCRECHRVYRRDLKEAGGE